MDRFKNKVVLITGGAAGIGKATARAFLNEKAAVIIWDLNEQAGSDLAEKWSAEGHKCIFARVDVSSFEDVHSHLLEAVSAFGSIDILINNAGITLDRSLLKMSPAEWQKVIDVNLTGVFNCTKAVATHMAERGSGVILNASSVVGLYGNFGQTNYVASKAGVIGMTKTWARELGRKGIRVNAVAPGFIATEMVEKMPEQAIEAVKSRTPLNHLGRPEDIANAYLFLASDEASFITGATLNVDGGLVL
jgi:3-oxoacyl-[acyl-carrier protein] reductase